MFTNWRRNVGFIVVVSVRVAGFFVTQYTKTGENMPNCH
jgi:hypothetical protein